MNIPNNLMDPRIDNLSESDREHFLGNLFINQLEFALKSNTEAIITIMKNKALELSDFKSYDDIQKFPPITKRMFREYGDIAFMPEKYRVAFKKGQNHLLPYEKFAVFPRFTGGTSVEKLSDYTYIVLSNSDWLGAMQCSTRGIKQSNKKIEIPSLAYVNYTWDHIAAPFFSSLVMYNGGFFVPRHVNLSDFDAFNKLKDRKCDGIISPPSAYKGKGRGLVELIAGDVDIDNPYINGENIRLVIVSSTPLTDRIYRIFENRSIVVKDGGGSTDTGAVLWNCTEDPLKFHSIEGNVLIEVVERNNYEQVANGEKGVFLFSKIAGVLEGNQLLRTQYQTLSSILHRRKTGLPENKYATKSIEDTFGRPISSIDDRNLREYLNQVKRQYDQSCRIIPNQAMQLLRMSVLMNETQYFKPEECGCGKKTAKLKGLERTWDLDGSPKDLEKSIVLEESAKGPDLSGYQLGLSDGCGNIELKQ